jgi:glucokinase
MRHAGFEGAARNSMSYAVGIDIGGTNIKAVAVSRAGELLSQRSVATEDAAVGTSRAEQAARWAEKVRDICDHARTQHGEFAGLGISSPGLAARDERSIAWMQGRMEAVAGLDWQQSLGFATPVPVLNDAQAALLGEAWVGAARGESDCILLTLGTGVGGAAMCDGNLLRGRLGRAGHLGHISLNPDGALDIVRTPGSLEDAIGECTLGARSQGRFPSTAQMLQAVANGDAAAARIWNQSVRALAAGIASLVNVLDPAVVILGGGIAKAGPVLFDPLRALLDEWEWRPTDEGVRVVEARLGDYAGAYGAAKRALGETQN